MKGSKKLTPQFLSNNLPNNTTNYQHSSRNFLQEMQTSTK
jgi:hypothetical protein